MMETLTQSQKATIADGLGKLRFPRIADLAGCSVGALREYAAVVEAERAKERERRWQEELQESIRKHEAEARLYPPQEYAEFAEEWINDHPALLSKEREDVVEHLIESNRHRIDDTTYENVLHGYQEKIRKAFLDAKAQK